MSSLTIQKDQPAQFFGKPGASPNYSTVLPEATLAQALPVAATDMTVLILGESGVGKSVLAKYIHYHSPRHNRRFVGINVAALPDTLLESELFGYEPGAFSGANRKRPGKIRYADRGTVFMDEMGDIAQSVQVKLLTVMEEKEVAPLGTDEAYPVDVRFLIATNRDLHKAVQEGHFRLDLFYRIQGFPIAIPPLRDRKQDIAKLVRYYYNRNALRYYREDAELDIEPAALDRLLEYEWPGNIRELDGLTARMAVEFRGKTVGLRLNLLEELLKAHRPIRMQSAPLAQGIDAQPKPYSEPTYADSGMESDRDGTELRINVPSGAYTGQVRFYDAMRGLTQQIERAIISRVLEQNRWNIGRTAKVLDVSYKTLLNKINELGLRTSRARQ